ncbi:MAG: D-alanine--D-alanine ligase [Rhodospirillaceae bacterium]|nr:D-alanine--D-alanine ligase [Rhodospirillaceae bacterium]
MKKARVGVLMGGVSREREVSLESGRAVCKALKELNYTVVASEVGDEMVEVLAKLCGHVDVIFNALHGPYGEDGCVQGLCELLKLPYTHSGVLASALAMDKVLSKKMFRQAGIPVPDGEVRPCNAIFTKEAPTIPFVVKPIGEGSSLGVRLVGSKTEEAVDDPLWSAYDEVLVEEYIPGRELTVLVMNEKSIEVLEIKPKDGFYDFDSKYTPGFTEYIIPARLSQKIRESVLDYAQLAHAALGCSGVTRADFRYDESRGDKGIKLLEINTQPGLTATSLVPQIAAYAGLSFNSLVDWIVRDAQCKV